MSFVCVCVCVVNQHYNYHPHNPKQKEVSGDKQRKKWPTPKLLVLQLLVSLPFLIVFF